MNVFGPSPGALAGENENELCLFFLVYVFSWGSLQGPSVGNVTRRRPERTLFTVANSWTSRDCESQIALQGLRSFEKSQTVKVESRIEYQINERILYYMSFQMTSILIEF